MKDAQSSYNPAVAIYNEGQKKAAKEAKHKVVSVNFGSHHQNFLSEAKQMFQGKPIEERESTSALH